MRITGGEYKGRKIRAPGGYEVRPTSDRVREALFSIIAGRVSGSNVLDLFAGSGSFGLEALSRGAAYSVFVEQSRRVASVLLDNLKILGVNEMYFEVVISDAINYLKRASRKGSVFDIIFIDPPYNSLLGERVMAFLADLPIIANEGLILNEYRKGRDLIIPPGFKLEKEKTYGDTAIVVCTRRGKKS